MKKHLVMGILVIAVMFITVGLAETQLNIPETDMQITIPDGCYYLDREVTDDNEALDILGMTADDVRSGFTSSGIYLYIIPEHVEWVLSVTSVENEISDLYDIGDALLPKMKEQMDEGIESMGYNILSSEYIYTPQALYVNMRYTGTTSGDSSSVIQYYTIRNNQAINITLYSAVSELSETMILYEKMIVNSIVYGDGTPNPAYAAHNITDESDSSSSAAITGKLFTDEDTGLTFTLPDGWKEADLLTKRVHIDIKFKKNGQSIMYGSMTMAEFCDSWGISEDDLPKNCDLNEVWAFMLKDDDETASVEINGLKYIKIHETIEGTLDQIGLIHFDGDHVYEFQFALFPTTLQDGDEEKLTEEFNSLMESVVYPGK